MWFVKPPLSFHFLGSYIRTVTIVIATRLAHAYSNGQCPAHLSNIFLFFSILGLYFDTWKWIIVLIVGHGIGRRDQIFLPTVFQFISKVTRARDQHTTHAFTMSITILRTRDFKSWKKYIYDFWMWLNLCTINRQIIPQINIYVEVIFLIFSFPINFLGFSYCVDNDI